MSGDGLRDEIAWLVHDNVCGCRGSRRCDMPDEDHYAAADAVQAHIDAAREQAIRDAADAYPLITRDMVSRGSVRRWLLDNAVRIARQHAKEDGDA